MISIASPILGIEEKDAVFQVLLSGQLAQGAQVAAFEQRFAEICDVEEAVAVSSGTAALHLALLAHGVGPGDEVITTAFSFAATALIPTNEERVGPKSSSQVCWITVSILKPDLQV